MRILTLLGLLALAACGADGPPLRPGTDIAPDFGDLPGADVAPDARAAETGL